MTKEAGIGNGIVCTKLPTSHDKLTVAVGIRYQREVRRSTFPFFVVKKNVVENRACLTVDGSVSVRYSIV